MRVRAVIFDKDGTLFDFAATWSDWAATILSDLAAGDLQRQQALGRAVGFDLGTRSFRPDSPVIAGTNREVATRLAAALPGAEVADVEALLVRRAAEAPLAEAVPLAPLMRGLAELGLRLGLMTNDSEAVARAHLRKAALGAHFASVLGADSGYGAKPDPAPLLAAARALGVLPGATVMVGDSTHDLRAGRAAGMRTIGVLTGPAGRAELAPLADAVLPDIGHLPDWLAADG